MLDYRTPGTDVDAVFAALADPTRRQLLEQLDGGPASVSVLAEPYDVTLSCIAQHLRVLESAGLISSQKVGRKRTCSLDHTALTTAQKWIEQRRTNWDDRLDRLADHLNNTQTGE